MTWLIASDLDRTLVYSERAMRLGDAVPEPVCVEIYNDAPTSFTAPATLAALRRVSAAATFVPTTTRTVEQYSRIAFPGVRAAWAITTNGAVILDQDGVPCPQWARQVAENVRHCAPFEQMLTRVDPLFSQPWVLKRRSAEDQFLYAVYDVALAPSSWHEDLAALAADCGWVLSLQGRKAYLIPGGLPKEAALAELVRRVQPTSVAAAGDSLLDIGLLLAADLRIRPAHGELEEQQWTCPGLEITGHAGGLAGVEIAERFAAAVGVAAASPQRVDSLGCGPAVTADSPVRTTG